MADQPDYHDYVIKDGRFIGRFEEMYRACEDPWHQSAQPNRIARWAGIEFLRRYGARTAVEFGCGLGYYSDWIHRETGMVPVGYDISETAVAKARMRFPHLDFRVGNTVDVLAQPLPVDAILFAEIGWYILEDFDRIMGLLRTHHAGKLFVNNQVFYKGTQRYGTAFFTDLDGYVRRVPFDLLGRVEATTERDGTIETSAVFRIG